MGRMDLMRWTPFAELQLMRDFLTTGEWPSLEGRRLAVNMYDKDDMLCVEAHLPGYDKDEVKVTVDDGILTIRADHKDDKEVKEDDYYLHETRYGMVSRSVRLPGGVDTSQAHATHKDGVLTITFPRIEKAEGHTIPVETV